MSDGFEVDWLALREPADHAARAIGAIERSLSTRSRWRGLDLGGGTGSNLRYLIPRLGADQDWLLVDHDPRLLAAATGCFARWSAASGFAYRSEGDAVAIAGPDWSARVRCRQADLAAIGVAGVPSSTGSAPPLDGGFDLITAAALLDLVSEDWLARLIAWCAAQRVAWLFALTYDGRIEWRPPLADDGAVAAAFDRDQRRDKGFGPALGPGAVDALRRLATAAGYRVASVAADWRFALDHPAATEATAAGGTANDATANEAAMIQDRLAIDFAAVAARTAQFGPGRIETWLQARRALIAAGQSSLVVGHHDLAGWFDR
ncbi:MAG: class I SAM-dependent methyltransferase [Burkholderiaceae bacterium]